MVRYDLKIKKIERMKLTKFDWSQIRLEHKQNELEK